MQIETGSLDWSSQTTLKRRREDEASEEISRPGKKIGYGCHMFAERISVKEENECCAGAKNMRTKLALTFAITKYSHTEAFLT